ncbi:A/G-specific adenine glycosylase [Ferrimicrobium sp.]|uniref:A/G-specific adenine glycosylase n=1 Tax=Ferrimicrobium sp. TaxID=2926050 RepID=UPI002637FED7|nr:A/G-specific adenine glycosylase [Ferrimicrobium sp.]
MKVLKDQQQRLQTELLAWGNQHRRALPWRETRDPFLVLVAEVMLTQTQVSRVATIFPSFVQRFPTIAVLADAPIQELLALWSGLGYNRRALRLRECARSIHNQHQGLVPDDYRVLRSLPGIGPYIANAILAQAFNHRVSALDTNTRRVLLRAFFGTLEQTRELQRKADELVPAGQIWTWTQAVFDLGATICRPQPACAVCPLQEGCLFQGRGDDPHKTPRRQSTFEGSHRQLRGRVIAAFAQGVTTKAELARHIGLSDSAFDQVYNELAQEGFFEPNTT